MKLTSRSLLTRLTGSYLSREAFFVWGRVALASSGLVVLASRIEAATYYWDTNGATAGSGAATATWDGTTANWTTDSAGSTTPTITLTTNLDDLIFSAGTNGTTGTVAVTGAQAANSITFDDDVAVTLNGGTSITLGGGGGSNSGITVASGVTQANVINTPIILGASTSTFAFTNNGTGLLTVGAITGSATSGTQTLTLASTSTGGITLSGIIGDGAAGGKVALVINNSGAGVTTLTGVNTFTGGITIAQGTLSYAANTALGGASGTAGAVTLNGGTLLFTAAGVDNTHAITVGPNGGTIKTSGAGTFRFGVANTLLGSGPLTIIGTGSLVTTGQGVVVLNNSNTYNGNVTLQSGGVIEYANASGLATNATVTVGNNGNLSANGVIVANAATVNAGGVLGFQNTGNGVFAGNITLNGAATAQLKNWWSTAAQNGTIAGNISGSGSLTISNNTATLTLLGANTYTGNTVIGTGATLVDVEPVSRTYAAVISGAGAYIKGGPGILTLTGANTYTGATTIRGGTVQVGDGTSGSLASTTTLTFGDTGKFNYQGVSTGSSQSLGATTFSAGAGTVQSTYGSSGNTALTLANVVARTAGATGNFVVSGGTLTGATPTNKIVFTQVAGVTPTTGALLDKGYYFNGADFAAYDTNGYVRALAYGTDTNTVGADTITAANHVKLTATPTGQNSISLLTLNLAGSGVSWANNASQTLTLSGGGLIKSGGGTVGTISGGTAITTGGATELVVRTDTVADSLTISIPFTGSTGGLTKTGLGTLTLAGTGNSYTGATTIDEGTLTLSGTYTGGSAFTVRNGGTLNINGASNGNIIVVPASGGVAIANVNAAVTLASGNALTVGSAGGVGVLNVAANISGGNQAINVGTGGFGSLGVVNVTAGTVTPGQFLVAGNNTGSSGIWNISGGAVATTGNNGGTLGIGGTNIVNTGVMNITSGSYSSTDATASGLSGIYVGENAGGTGILNISGTGTANLGGVSTSVALNIGRNNGANGIVNLGAVSGGGSGSSGGGTINTFRVQKTGSTATGIFNFHGGTLKASTGANATFMTGLTAAYVYGEGGTVDNNAQAITIGQALLAPTGSGVTSLTLSGSTTGFTPGATPLVTLTGGGGTGATAVANVDGSGNLTVIITNPGTGYTSAPVVVLTGATGTGSTTVTAAIGANSSGGLIFQGSSTTTLTGTSTYTGGTAINAGTLALGNATDTLANTGAINVNGGTLSLGTNSDTVGAVTLSSGAITGSTGILSGSSYGLQSGSVSAILGGTGSTLTKSTAGSVILSGANTYTGATLINGGTLTLSGTGSINSSSGITINGSGAKLVQISSVASTPAITLTQGTLDGTGTVGAVTVGAGTGGIVTNGNGSTSKLTMSSLTFSGAGTLLLNLAGGATTTEAMTVTNAFTTSGIAGSITVNLAAVTSLNSITYNLIGFGSFSGNLSDFVVGTGLTTRQNGTFGTSGNFLTLTISGDAPKWTGLDNGNWVVGFTGSNSNWKLITSGQATNYISGDTVLFDDSAAGTTTVDISAANVTPILTTFNNSTKDYVIGSSGGFGITGSSGITKNGTGKVTITAANSYTGVTAINAGSINLQNNAALGATSNVAVASGAALELQGGISVDARPLTISGAGLAASPAGVLRNVNGANSFAGLLTLAANATIQSDAGSLALTNPGTITGSGFTLTLAGAGDGSIASIIGTGAGSLIKNGVGTWTLSGANTYTGGTIINGGTLIVGNASALGTTGNTLTFGASSSGTLILNGISISVLGLNGDSTATINDSNATAATLTVNKSSGTDTFAGILANGATGTLALTKSGAGTLVLSGTNTFSGTTTISVGTLQFNGASAMSSTSALTMSSGSTLSLVADADTTFTPASTAIGAVTVNISASALSTGSNKTLTLGGTTSITGDGVVNVSASNGYAVAIPSLQLLQTVNDTTMQTLSVASGNTLQVGTVTANDVNDRLAFTGAGNTVVTGPITQAQANRGIGLVFNQSGTVTLSGTGTNLRNNTNGGSDKNVVLNSGTVNFNSADAIRSTQAISFIINGGTIDNTSGSAETLTGSHPTTINADFAFGGTNDLNLGTSTITLGTTAGTSRTITTNGAATLTLGGVISNGTTATGFAKAGTGTLTLTGANTYTGTTTIAAGTLIANSAQALNTTALGGNVSFTGGTLKYGSAFAAGANADISSRIKNSTGAVAIDTNGQTVSYASAIDSSNVGGLTKSGNGTLTLAAANDYTGTTTVSVGELIVSGSLNGTTNVSVASGTTLASGTTGSIATAIGGNVSVSGTLAPGDFSSVGTLTLAPGTGGKLNFLSGSTIDFTISGVTSDQVSFSTADDWLSGSGNVTLSLTGLTGSDYANTYTVFHNVSTTGFALAGITGYDAVNYLASFTQVGGDYQLSFTAIPEPNMATSLLGGLGVLALFRRRRGKSHA